MTDGTDEINRAVEAVMTKFRQPEKVRRQYLKFIENLVKGNDDEADLNRMIEALEVGEDGGKG